jgi:hypothetical protein
MGTIALYVPWRNKKLGPSPDRVSGKLTWQVARRFVPTLVLFMKTLSSVGYKRRSKDILIVSQFSKPLALCYDSVSS